MKVETIHYTNQNCSARITKSKEVRKGLFFDDHTHSELEFLYVVSGKMMVSSNGTNLIIQNDEIAFINSSVVHSTLTLEDDTIYCIIQFPYHAVLKYPFKYLSLLSKQHSHPLYIFKKNDCCYEKLLECVLDMLERNSKDSIANDYYLLSIIHKTIAILYEKNIIHSNDNLIKENLSKIALVFEYIDAHFSEPLSLKLLADNLSFNKDYFCRMFKKTTGITVFEYLNFVRICKAEELFSTNRTFTEISSMVGFSSAAYFNKVFRKYKGVSPSKYKKYLTQNSKRIIDTQFEY